MTNLGLIGAGNIGSALAALARESGRSVVLSNSRGPETLTDLAAALGPHASAGTIRDAARADLVVITIPLGKLEQLPPDLLDGAIVIDTMNYYPERDGRIEALDANRTTTTQLTADHFPGARVVKGFNNIIHTHLRDLARPSGAPDRSTLPIASDDSAAKSAVAELLDALGYDVLDVGPLAEGWRFENGQPAYCLPYAADPDALRARRPGGPVPAGQAASRDTLLTALSQARRA